jgi:hypothetical protein
VWADAHAEAHLWELKGAFCSNSRKEHSENPTPSCRPLLNINFGALEHISRGDDYCWLEAIQNIIQNSGWRGPWGWFMPALMVSSQGNWGPEGSSDS